MVPPPLLSPGVLQLKGCLPAVSQIQLLGEEMDVVSFFSAKLIRAKRCSQSCCICEISAELWAPVHVHAVGQEEGFINPGRGVGEEESSPDASLCCKLSHYVTWPWDRSFLPLASGTRISTWGRKDCSACSACPSNSPHLDNSSNVSWFYCITVLGDTILLFLSVLWNFRMRLPKESCSLILSGGLACLCLSLI